MSNIRGFFSDNEDKTVFASKANCTKCGLYKTCRSPKMGMTGKGKKGIFVLAEGPGEEEDMLGTQLIGDSGQELRKYLKKFDISLDRDCWKMNCVNCRPPNNREPSIKEMQCCRPMVEEALLQTEPKAIFVLGTKALQSHFMGMLDKKYLTISNWTRHQVPDWRYNAWVFPLFHPAALLYSQNEILNAVYEKDLKWSLNRVDTEFPKFKDPEKRIKLLTDFDEVIAVLEKLREYEYLFYDYETSNLKPYFEGSKIFTVAVAGETGKVYAFPYHYVHWTETQLKKIQKKWQKLLSDDTVRKVTHNLKFEMKWSKYVAEVIPENNYCCTMTLQHCLDTRRFQSRLDFQVLSRYGREDYGAKISPFKKNTKNGFNTLHKVPLLEILKYNALDTYYLRELFFDQQEELENKKNIKWFYKNIFHKGILSLSESEDTGIPINSKYFLKTRKELTESLIEQEDNLMSRGAGLKFKKKFGRDIDIQSPKDLRLLFYDILGLPATRKTKKDFASVDAYTLQHIDVPFSKNLLKFRKTKKRYDYVNEYCESNVEGKLHPSIDLNHAASGRSNSSNPNLHNVPVRDEESAALIRGGIIPSKGNFITECDYKAVEVRIMTCYTHDPVMIKYVVDPTKDMHRDQAIKIFKLPIDEITKPLRHIGKNDFVFPEFYGDWYSTCAASAWEDCDTLETASGILVKDHLSSIKINSLAKFTKHMQKVENDFWEMFKVTKAWRKEVVEQYLKKGYVDTFFGFRRNGFLDRNQIINTPVQGTAFHCLLWSYNRLTKYFHELKLVSKIIGQIHDSILVDTYPPEREKVWALLKRVMEEEICKTFDWLVVPLEVEIEATGIDEPWCLKKAA